MTCDSQEDQPIHLNSICLIALVLSLVYDQLNSEKSTTFKGDIRRLAEVRLRRFLRQDLAHPTIILEFLHNANFAISLFKELVAGRRLRYAAPRKAQTFVSSRLACKYGTRTGGLWSCRPMQH